MKIAVAFFGINRSLKHTVRSIESNIFAPLRAIGDVKIFGHFYNLTEIDNPRSGESAKLEASQHALIDFDSLILGEPNNCLSRFDLDRIFAAKDPYLDDYKSVRNLLHQLHSLDSVTRSIQKIYQPDVVVFARPDLCYHDSFGVSMQLAIRSSAKQAFLPSWQRYGGYNDRFAICNGDSYIAYGGRANLIDTYVNSRRPLYAELFLYYALRKTHIRVSGLEITASRVRVDGRVESELFSSTGLVANTLMRYKLALKHSL